MKKITKQIFIFSLGIIALAGFVGQVLAQTGAAGGSGSGGGGIGGQVSSSGCIWNNKNSSNNPHTYMIDLVKKSSKDSKYTIIASAVVGKKANSDHIEYNKRSNVKKIKTSGKVSQVSEIKNLETLAKYLNKHGDLNDVGTKLSQKAIWEMLYQLGVATYDSKTKKYTLNSTGAGEMTIEQSKNLSDNYGYRILIQEFFPYKKTNCTSNGTTSYLLRKESSVARSLTNSGLGVKEELTIHETNALGIKKHGKSGVYSDADALADPMNGAGYNIIWMDLTGILETYKCSQISGTPNCKIQKYDSKKGKWIDVKTNFACNGQSTYKDNKGKIYKLTKSCPKPEAECKESDKYGTCKITTKVGKYKKTETTDCNNLTGTAGKTEYDGITLTPNCPFKPKWNYDIDAACENCDSTTTGGSYQVQDVVDWEAVLHSIERNDNPTLQTYYDKGNGILCKESFNVVFPNKNNVKDIHINKGRYFTVNEKGSTYINGVYNFEPIKITRTRQCISTNTDAAAAQNALTTFSNKKSIKELGTVSLKYNEKYKNSKYNTTQTLIADQERIKNYDKQFSSTVVAGKTYQILTDTTEGYFKIKDSNLYRFISIQNGLSQSTKPADTSKYIDVQKPNLPISLKNEEGATVALYYELPSDSKLKDAVKSNKANYLEDKPTYDNVYRRNINPSETACAKLYGLNTDKYNKCKAERSSSKKADVTAANKCLVQLGPNATFKYICDIIPEDDENKNCYPIATSKGEEQKYICKNGNVCDAATYAKECGPKCVITNGKYYGQNGVEVSKEEYERQCPGTPLECGLDCPECGYCCPDTTMMCAVKDADGNCSCPGKGNKIIYRPIDLTNPFPGQTNYQRATGSNWCARLSNGKTTCKNTNSVVTRHITNNRSTANEGVYRLETLYTVELNANNIREIRRYNDTHNYEDFTLSCDKGTCKSNFLRDRSASLQLSGVCNSSNYDELRRCAERGAGR